MKPTPPRTSHLLLLTIIVAALFSGHGFAQSQASDGRIKGCVTNENEDRISNAIVTATNIDIGVAQTATTIENGLYIRRLSRGLSFNSSYTLSKGTDDAPEQNLFNAPSTILSDPYNRRLDRSHSYADQRHTFVMDMVAQPTFHFDNDTLSSLFNNNQFGIFAYANSGERFNIVAMKDLDNDGVMGTSDRPVGIKRNSGKTPPQFNVDPRYSRLFHLSESYRLEVFGEFQNLFNVNCIVQYNNLKAITDTQGVLLAPLPDFKSNPNNSVSQESRQFQMGFKFVF